MVCCCFVSWGSRPSAETEHRAPCSSGAAAHAAHAAVHNDGADDVQLWHVRDNFVISSDRAVGYGWRRPETDNQLQLSTKERRAVQSARKKL